MPTTAQVTAGQRRLANRSQGRPPITRVSMPAGAAPSTNIPIAGIRRDSLLISVFGMTNTLVTGTTDRTATTSITSDGNIQSTDNTAAERLLVVWLDRK